MLRILCTIEDLPEGQSKKFIFKKGNRTAEGFIVRFKGNFFAYVNQCQHMPLPLDWGDEDFFTPDKQYLICKNHGAVYFPDSGECVSGPCSGSSLKKMAVNLKGKKVFVNLKKEE